jgi:hypothetical protein
MAFTGVSMGLGLTLMIIGGWAVLGGLGVAIAGPDAVDDASGGSSDGGLLGLGGDGGDRNAEERTEVRMAGAAVAAVGAGLVLLGGMFYAAARGVEAEGNAEALD